MILIIKNSKILNSLNDLLQNLKWFSLFSLLCLRKLLSDYYCSDFFIFWGVTFKDIRLSENPVADPGRGGIPRFVLIARLAKVEILNGSEVNCWSSMQPTFLSLQSKSDVFLSNLLFQVSPRERKDSEIRYVFPSQSFSLPFLH